ncbi:unnamed protein product [Vitrella brassicaformis CCMP3155]|uniref:Adenylyl-sulfate kinase n=2 Tax=Vitrella brassicaformis TaxID=1169539 RepID=A0A0G4FAI4_VITBC|nr:unnamed protein product [Vitrella brassicaformis CCMP3155]|mmetsp:Transcript_40077/g.100286  ORF Transcript_40077/g.100286 Transcript_40077/m.100286 type:complete len:233 (+) Transcript_40077:68-766(+)|eukprot:CEM09906.1 unnamed protein product [Vitrella brassicaformis CCMP3155]
MGGESVSTASTTNGTTPYSVPAGVATKAQNIYFHEGNLSRDEREALMGHKGATIWMTGLSGSGKSTVAVAFEQVLHQRGIHAYRLDGDNVRFGLNKNLGFSAEDRAENIRRIGEVAKLFADAGMVVITSFISPYKADRDAARELHKAAGLAFYEVHVNCPLEEAEKRDPKGLYKKARAGQIKGFTGIDDPFEAPEQAEIDLRTDQLSVEQAVQVMLDKLEEGGILSAAGSQV